MEMATKKHTQIDWNAPGTTIAGKVRVRTFPVNRGRAFGDEGWMENHVRTMSFSLPHDLCRKLKSVEKDTVVEITYTGREGNAKMFTVERVAQADDSGAAAFAAELERRETERQAKEQARQQAVIAQLTPTYGNELVTRMVESGRVGVCLRREGNVSFSLVCAPWPFGPQDKNVDGVVGVITGRPKWNSTVFVTPTELLQAVQS